MARVPFKLRSSGPFKMMGSSPAKQELKAEGKRRELTKQDADKGEYHEKALVAAEKSREPSGKLVNTPDGVEGPKLERIKLDTIKQKTKKGPTINVPPHPDLKNIEKRKDTLKGRTGFEYDVVDPVKSKIRQGVRKLKKVYVDNPIHGAKNLYKKTKGIRDYFTKD